jgi:hypothetical protein
MPGYKDAHVKLVENGRLLAIATLNMEKLKDQGKITIERVFF